MNNIRQIATQLPELLFQIESYFLIFVLKDGTCVKPAPMMKLVAAIIVASLTAACSLMPSDGPTASDIMASKKEENQRPYLLVDLSHETANAINALEEPPFSSRFAAHTPAQTQVIGVGDTLSIVLFEAGQGGLFSSDSGARVQFSTTVGANGMISIPYAGEVRARGRTTEALEKAIIAGLDGKAIQPQALVTISQNVANTVVVSGDVSNPGRYPLVASGDRVLDAVANAGGSRYSAYESQVLLVRGSVSGAVSVSQLMHSSADNIYLRPGDKIFVTRSPRTFTVFGSTKRSGTLPIDTEKMTLLEAMGKASGLDANTANVRGVFIFRYETDRLARALIKNYDGRFGDRVPVVYRVDMKNPNSYFFANNFYVRSKDVVYTSSAPLAQVAQFMRLVSGVNSVASAGANLQRLAD